MRKVRLFAASLIALCALGTVAQAQIMPGYGARRGVGFGTAVAMPGYAAKKRPAPYVYPCNEIVSCTYGFSLMRQLAPWAKTAFSVYNATTTASTAIGFDSSHNTSYAQLMAACGSGQDCRIVSVPDQISGSCVPVGSSTTDSPLLDINSKYNIPRFVLGWRTGSPAAVYSPFSTTCGAITGNHKITAQAVIGDAILSGCCGWFGIAETNHSSVDAGSMFSAGTAWSGGVGPFLAGWDVEAAANWATPASGETGDVNILGGVYNGSTISVSYNGAVIQNNAPGRTPAFENGMNLGRAGDWTDEGGEFYEILFTPSQTSADALAQLYANTYSYIHKHPKGYASIGGMVPLAAPSYEAPYTTYLTLAYSCTYAQNAGYLGPLCNVCQGVTATCEDIGQVNGALNTQQAMAFCGPSNCTVATAYNQGIGQVNSQTRYSTANATQATASKRPALNFNCNGTILPCMTSTGTQYLVTGTPVGGNNTTTFAVAAVSALTTSGFGAIISSASTNVSYVGYGGTSGQAEWQTNAAANGTITPTGISLNALHSFFGTYTNVGPSSNFWVDGTNYGPSAPTSAVGYGANANGILSNPAGSATMKGNVFEVDVFNTTGVNNAFNFGATQMAAIRANQKSRYSTLP